MNHLDWETTDEKFLTAWQGLIRQSVYEQGQELLAYAESFEPKRELTVAEQSTLHAQAMAQAFARKAEAEKPKGEKHERIFTDQQEAIGFAILTNGVVCFWNDSPGFKVVWYTYNTKEVS